VPLKSLVIDVAANKSVCEMQKLFEEKQASPFDMVDTKFGLWTILDVCLSLFTSKSKVSEIHGANIIDSVCYMGSSV